MRTTKTIPTTLVVVAAVVTGCASAPPEGLPKDEATPSQAMIVAEGDGWLPGDTVEDWATYADHVLEVTPTNESEVPPTDSEIKRGEGLIQRRLTLHVDAVLWTSPRANRPAPESMSFLAWGWRFSGGNLANRTEMAASDAPRVETGHRYLIAVAWQEARCRPGDEPVPARWRALGSDAIVPYDDQQVGLGESEGHAQSVSQAAAKADNAGPDVPLETQLAGKGNAGVRSALKGTPPGKRLSFGPPATATACD